VAKSLGVKIPYVIGFLSANLKSRFKPKIQVQISKI